MLHIKPLFARISPINDEATASNTSGTLKQDGYGKQGCSAPPVPEHVMLCEGRMCSCLQG